MAPSTETNITQPVLSFTDLKASLMRLEEYYIYYNIHEDHVRIQRAKITADKKILEICQKAEKKPSKWIEFKKILTNAKSERLMYKLSQMCQKYDEPVTQWAERMYALTEEYEIDPIPAMRILERYTTSQEDRKICESIFWARRTLEDMEEGVETLKGLKAQIDYEKRMKELNRKNAMKRRRKDNKKANIEEKKEINNAKQVNEIRRKDNKKDAIKKEKMRIDGKEKEVIMDTGSQVNIMDKNVVEEEGLEIKKIKPQELTSVIGGKKIIEEKIQASVENDGVIVNTEFMVTNTSDPTTILIGNPTMVALHQKKREIEELTKKFPEVFNKEPSTGYKGKQCEIETEPDKRVRVKQRKIPQALLEGARKAIKHLEEVGYIETSTSSWYNPIKPVLKPTGEVRITSNMQFLNNLTEDDKYSIPNIQRVIEKCCNKRWFTVLDLKDGYFQIILKKEHRYKTAFYFENKLYQWTRMPQGYKNSPATFQKIMDEILKEEIGTTCNVYLDDIIIYGKDEKEHDKNLEKILRILKENRLKVNPEKIQYKQECVKLLGCIIDGKTRKPLEERKAQMLNFQEPKDKKELQRFLGFANYYRSYLKDLASTSACLYELLKKNKKYEWKEEHKKAFEKIREAINEDIAIYIPDFDKEFILKTDASNEGIGAILQQYHDGKLEVVDWASKKLNETEKKYGITEKEFLALAWAIEHYDYYLRGRKFKAITDHTAIIAMKTKPIFGNLRLERMRERLQEYDFDIEYMKGKELVDADAISRIYQPQENDEKDIEKNKNVLISADGTWYWKTKENEIKIFPKVEERYEIMKKSHEETTFHRGTDAMLYEIKKNYYWKKMEDSVKDYLSKCEQCVRNHQKSKGGEIFIKTTKPLEKVGIDLLYISHSEFILMMIDYYTRIVRCRYLGSKETRIVTECVKEILDEIGNPEMIIADPGKEFASETFKKMCNEKDIRLHLICAEKHNENGRIERLNREMWQAIRKTKEADPGKEITTIAKEFEEKHNNTYHRGIKMTPNEAWINPENKILKENNSSESKYSEEFTQGKCENFEEGEKVAIEAKEIEKKDKKTSRFNQTGQIIMKLKNRTYLVRQRNKIVKRSHSQLKKI